MPTEKDTHTFTAAGDRFSIMQGTIYERPNFPYLLRAGIFANPGDAPTLLLSSGSDILARNAVLDELATTLVITTEMFQFRDTGMPNELIGAEVTATAAADVIRWLIQIDPL